MICWKRFGLKLIGALGAVQAAVCTFAFLLFESLLLGVLVAPLAGEFEPAKWRMM